jgi:hypothetical protein
MQQPVDCQLAVGCLHAVGRIGVGGIHWGTYVTVGTINVIKNRSDPLGYRCVTCSLSARGVFNCYRCRSRSLPWGLRLRLLVELLL